MCPTPTIVFVKDGMMYPVVGQYSSNWETGSEAVSDELSTFPVAVPTLIFEELGLGGPCGADGAM